MAQIETHNERPAAVWSSGGAAYNEVSRQIQDAIEHCVQRLQPRPGERILDLATGTGWTSRRVAQSGARVTGGDIATELLAAAEEQARKAGLTVEYQVADAEKLPFDAGAFDAVISTFGVMFASKPERAAAELARVTRKGGRVALATWSPDGSVFQMFGVMKAYMPPPPNPAPPSPFEWGRTERLKELLSGSFELGFERGTSIAREPDAESFWRIFSTGYGPTRTLAGSLEADRREALRRDFIAFHEKQRTPLGITMPRDYVITLGRRL